MPVTILDFQHAKDIRDGAVFGEDDQGEIWQLFIADYSLDGRTHRIEFFARSREHAYEVVDVIRNGLTFTGPYYEEDV